MGQVHYHEVSLEELVRSAGLIVVARPADPPHSITEIQIPTPAPGPDSPPLFNPDEPIPPYRKLTRHLVIDEVLFDGSAEGWVPGQAIDVAGADWKRAIELHTEYHAYGLARSPIYKSYSSSLTENETQFIAFLAHDGSGLCFSVKGARESLTRRKEVLAAISQRPPPVRAIGRGGPGFWARLFGRKVK